MCASFSSPSMKPQLLLFPPFSFQRFIDIVFRTKICPKLGLEAKKKRNNGVLFSHNLKVEENKIRFFFSYYKLDLCIIGPKNGHISAQEPKIKNYETYNNERKKQVFAYLHTCILANLHTFILA